MNSDEIWLLQLWSGVFGAALSAVLAAGVALLVVGLSNRHQSKLAATALAEQRAGLKLQLDEQRREATRWRQTEAIAEFVGAIEVHARRRDKTLDVLADSGGLADMQAAWTKLRMAGPEVRELAKVLTDWPSDMSTINIRMAAEREFKLKERGARDTAISAAASVSVFLPGWLELSEHQRAALLVEFRKEGEAIKSALERLDGVPATE